MPQGLFISKNGQGPKTSILIFEKGGKTDWTWFYKVTNDGYTMGTNRKEQKGNQLVECLTLFHEFVKQGKKPPESKNQFCIPVDWIKALDPRIKEKIRTETRADMSAKGKIDREKKADELDKKIKAKKATDADKQLDLKVFDQMLENRIQNEIAKRIDKAHNYSFNLANYRSAITDNQIVDWIDALKHIQPNGATTLDEVYKKLSNSKPENILPYLLKLKPTNALEADIAREYVSNLDNELITKHKELNVIKEILKSGAKYPKTKLDTFISLQKDFFNVEEDNIYKRVTCKLRGQGIFLRDKVYGKDLKTKRQQVIYPNQLLVAEMDAKYGGYGIIPEQCGNAMVSSHYYLYNIIESELLPSFLGAILQSEEILKQVKIFVKGTTNYSAIRGTDFLEIEIPIPSIDEQANIVAQIEKQKAIIEGAVKVLNNWEFPADVFNGSEGKTAYIMSEVCKFSGGSQPPKEEFIHEPKDGYVRLVQIRDFKSDSNITFVSKKSVTKFFNEYDIMIARYGPPVFQILRGLSGAYNVALMKAIPNEDIVLKDYWFYYLQNPVIQNFVIDNSQRTAGQSGVNLDLLYSFQIFLPDKIEQQSVVKEMNAKILVLEGLRKMKADAENKITKILADVWGIEFVEPVKEEVEDGQEN